MQRGVLAEAQAGELRVAGFTEHAGGDRRAVRRDARHVNRRLADVRLIEPLFRTGEAERGEVEAEDVVGSVEGFLRSGGLIVKILAHADRLGALSGTEDEGGLVHGDARCVTSRLTRFAPPRSPR